MSSPSKSKLTVAFYSTDPTALTSFHSFDPESFSLIPVIADALIFIGSDGEARPALATSWTRIAPDIMEFELRKGVKFHNGDSFDADDCVATFRAHQEPSPSACGGGVLSPIKSCEKVDSHRIRLVTHFPDAMLVRRLFFGQIYPKRILEEQGRDALAGHPIGTGAYRFISWERGKEIVLERNPEHWAGKASVDELRIPIVRQKEWASMLENGEIDVALNIDASDVMRLRQSADVTTASREAALSQWFLLANKGPLADDRVRQALNHAIHRPLLTEVAEFGLGTPQRSVATQEQEGFAPDVAPYRYSPELARKMLADAGYPNGFTLKGIVSETSAAVFKSVKEFLSRIDVHLEAEIVPRSEWIGRVVVAKLIHKSPYTGDFAVASVDNPLLHSLFHQFIFLFSGGPFSLTNDPDYDQAFLKAATEVDPAKMLQAQQELEHYVRDRALMLFTTQQQVHAAWRNGVSVALPRSGHFDAAAFWSLAASREYHPCPPLPSVAPVEDAGLAALIDATSHTGVFFLPSSQTLPSPQHERLWKNIETSERRWSLQNEPMYRELVSQTEAKNNLASVLGSTDRVGIVGYSLEGKRDFVNRGYELMNLQEHADILAAINRHASPNWSQIREIVNAEGSWVGAVSLAQPIEKAASNSFFLTVAKSHDEEGSHCGYTLVFSDFSGEEERIRSKAIRTILEHVPYGLFVCNADGIVQDGYSEACRRLVKMTDSDLAGKHICDLLRLEARERGHFEACFTQVFDDIFPEEVALAQIPQRFTVGPRVLGLQGSVVRDDNGDVKGVLFTLLDMTHTAQAEREAVQARATVQVMRFRERFGDFLRDFCRTVAELELLPASDTREARARRELHTAKGVFAQFGLLDISQAIHDMEDSAEIAASALASLRHTIVDLVQQNASTWNIHLDESSHTFTVSQSTIEELESNLKSVDDLEQMRNLIGNALRAMQQKTVAELMGPIDDAARLHAAKVGKQIALDIQGSQVRFPAQLAPVFRTLTHLVRNAIDHGVEAPEDRNIKPKQATIDLAAQRNAKHYEIVIRDDGRGISTDAIIARAQSMGLLSPEQAKTISSTEALQLVFSEGLSTAAQITETSGRGVGMAAVKAAVESAGGTVDIESAPGHGTTFTLRFAA